MAARSWLRAIAQIATVALLLWLWERAGDSGWINRYFVGSPGGVADRLRTHFSDGTIWSHIMSTVYVLGVGFAIGIALGVGVGAAIGLSQFVREVLEPFIVFVNALPRLILQPFLVIWLGFSVVANVTLVVLVIWVITAVNVASAFREIDRDILSNLKLMGAGRWEMGRDLYGPALSVWLIGSSRATFGLAFQAAIVAGFIGGNQGLGYLIVQGTALYDIDTVWAVLAVVVVIAAVGDGALSFMQRRASRWMPEQAPR